MPGQGVIVGVGSIDFPAEFQGADERALGTLGVSKVVTITSTYDHRIIQGAESGLFLKRVHELLLGDHGFYEAVFKSLGVPYEAVKWRSDVNPLDSDEARLQKQMQIATLIRRHRSVALERAEDAGRTRSGHLRLHHLGPRPRIPHRRRLGHGQCGRPGSHVAR
jgi:hypothetical protein